MSETTQLELMGDADDQDVETLLQGWAGQSTSPRKLSINLTDAIPNNGFWHAKIWNLWDRSTVVTMRVWRVGDAQSLSSKGFIRKPKLSSGVGKASEMAYEFHGEPGEWV